MYFRRFLGFTTSYMITCYLLLLLSYHVMGDKVSVHQPDDFPIKFDENELKERLTEEQFEVTQRGRTERAFSGIYYDNTRNGLYRCVVCHQELFSSSMKFDSGCGWPSFLDILKEDAVKNLEDTSFGMKRIEIVCSKCGSHLGHLFNDGPQPTGKRYCMNSASLHFEEEKGKKQEL